MSARGAHRDSLLFRQVEVVAGLRLEAGLERLGVEVDAQQPRRPRLDGLGLDESTALEERRPFVADPGVWLDPEDQPPSGGRAPLQRIQDQQAIALGHHRPARHVVDRPARKKGGATLHRADAGAALVNDQPLDAPAEARLELAPLPALQQVRLGLRQQQLIPGRSSQSLAGRDGEGGLRQTRADPRAQTARRGEWSASRRG